MTTLNARGFLFDMDGTLVDSAPVVENIWINFCAHNGLNAKEVIAYAHGRQVLDTLSHFIGAGEAAVKAAEAIEQIEIRTSEGVTAITGAAEFLARLPAGRVALVTSAGRELAESRMRAAGIPLPAVTVCAEDVVNGKPDPECYLKAASMLGVSISECLVFEDAAAGIRAGLASGARVIAVNPSAA